MILTFLLYYTIYYIYNYSPGITQSDLLICNKTDLAASVGADLVTMERQAKEARSGGPVVMAQVKYDKMIGVDEIIKYILDAWNDHKKHTQVSDKKQKI